MDDLISRQAAIDAIFSEPLYESGMKKRDADAVVPAIYEKIKSLPSAQPEPHWIPCSERLPEHDGEPYLVTDYCEQINCKRMHISYCYMNREGFWSDVPIGYKVIAWMPLPELYKEVQK